ncbi:phospholipase A-2-activating protein [Abortiporus biennis]|nr:phospholipase A-2-activating protein [Abortiporus biennis]
MPYKLSATLSAHTSDVRAVASPRDDLILSASRDTTAITWTRSAPNVPFVKGSVLRAGTRFVSAVTYIPPSPDAPEGYVVTGGQDTVINVFSLAANSDEPNFSLLGHTQNVCALSALADGTIISGSWDQTARVWKGFALAYELKGHEQSVWTVLAIDSDQYLTGSADNTIKLWHQHKNIMTYTGHTQAVRSLALVPDIGFVSCSNDSEIRVWTMEGDLVYTLSGHTSFVYSVSVLANGDIVSGGEDRTVRVWRDGECVQTIVHPAISVWAVSTMPNGDIVTGCSDGVVRVFSSSEERWAPAAQIKAYEEQVAATALPAQQVGDVKKSDLPGPEALSQPGKKPGDVKMIRNGDSVEAHQWDSASGSWQKIGDVVDAVGSGRKQLYEGREYDYVFDVDVQEGAPPLKLPFNANENPYVAAQKFLEKHDLPLSYLDEVVKFIEKNSSAVNISTGSSTFVDPYTGASRYQPQGSTGSAGSSDFMDPFTGASRYRAPASAPAPTAPPATSDPWTGANRYSGSSTPVATLQPATKSVDLPIRTILSFRQAKVEAMQAKFYQFDEVLRNEISTSSLAMYNKELALIDESFAYLNQAVTHPSSPPATPLTVAHIDTIIALLERWPSSQRFPVMDLSRLVVGYCSNLLADTAIREKFISALFHGADWSEPWQIPLPKPRETNVLLLFRALANGFQDDTIIGNGVWVHQILEKLGEVPYTTLTGAQRVALATVLFNLSCVALRQPLSPTIRSMHTTLVLQILQTEKSDSEAAYRALVALGNIIYAANTSSSPLDTSQVELAKTSLNRLPLTFNEGRITNMATGVRGLIL